VPALPLREIQAPFPDWPRYAPERPLPAYRYVPGLHPHPVSDPRGHSYGHRPATENPPAPEAWASCTDYRHSVDLHNFGYWWEAHEGWEGIWQHLDKAGEQGQFLQGLIQTSAGLLKAHLGSREGARILFGEAMLRLSGIRPRHYMGVDLALHRERIAACLKALDTGTDLPRDLLPLLRLHP